MPQSDNPEEIDVLRAWFAERGFGIAFADEHHVVWANLTRQGSAEVIAEHYGRGATALEAALRSRQRYLTEQDASE